MSMYGPIYKSLIICDFIYEKPLQLITLTAAFYT